jgi:SAM-dependent methyltransferase
MPPEDLVRRVGHQSADDARVAFHASGEHLREFLHSVLPAGWSFSDKRVLDFGCGSGRVLRHMFEEAEQADLHGCDIDEPSIAWARENLCPPVGDLFLSGAQPPLPKPADYYDLIYAFSVFTHLTDQWSNWMVELHRLLRRDGILVLTFSGKHMSERLTRIPWDENRIGMNVLRMGQSWKYGGPMVMHSRWWIKAHWGRGFDILTIENEAVRPGGQGVALLRKQPVVPTVEDFEREEPHEPRELAARRQQLLQLQAEGEDLHRRLSKARKRIEAMRQARISQQRKLKEQQERLSRQNQQIAELQEEIADKGRTGWVDRDA